MATLVTKQTLEELIGLPPNPSSERLLRLRLSDLPATRVPLEAWLNLEGILPKSTKSATLNSIILAYCNSGYRRSWRNRVNPAFDLLGGDDDDDATTETQVPTAQTSTQSVDPATIRDVVNTLINEKLANTKIELSDKAKGEIRDLASSAAIAKTLELLPPRQIEITSSTGTVVTSLGLQHERFPTLLRAAQVRDHRGFHLNIWLTGPTGSGKTSAAEAVSRALEHTFTSYTRREDGVWEIRDEHNNVTDLNGLSHDSPFGADGSLDADYKVIGFKDANGKFHWTTFLRIFVFGGIYVADEIDNWSPSALLALNAALANGWISTPIGLLQRHPDACIIACANTWGLGATNDYVGRTKLDAASLDRFQPKIHWPIDEKLEGAIAFKQGGEIGLRWHDLVLDTRSKARVQGLKVIISPRATFSGIALLRQGFEPEEVVAMTLSAGLSAEQAISIGLHKIGGLSELVL